MVERDKLLFVERIDLTRKGRQPLRLEASPSSNFASWAGALARIDAESRFADGTFVFARMVAANTVIFAAVLVFSLSVLLSMFVAATVQTWSRRSVELAAARRGEELALQVSHDIRSPLSAIMTTLRSISPVVGQKELAVLSAASGRIQEIAEDLLSQYRSKADIGRSVEESSRGNRAEPLRGAEVESALRSVVGEKLGLGSASDKVVLTIVSSDAFASSSFSAQLPALKRIVSNLINNSLEALPPEAGVIVVRLAVAESGTEVSISVQDNGKGIPQAMLLRLGQRGSSFGKLKGNGLGLYFARESVEAWGGRFEVKSELGRGTEVRLVLPSSGGIAAPEASHRCQAGPDVVFVDDDIWVRESWELSAEAAGVRLMVLDSVDAVFAAASTLPRGTPIFLDSLIGEDSRRGEDVAQELHRMGFVRLFLASGLNDELSARRLPWIAGIQGKEPPDWGKLLGGNPVETEALFPQGKEPRRRHVERG